MLAQTLETTFGNNSELIIKPGHPGYDKLRRVWNGLADRHPAAIVRAAGVADVQGTVRLAAESGSLLAVRCGGHSIPGLSTCEGGIVLDLSAMNRVTIDPVARIAEVEGGALLGDLDRASDKHGLVVPAGVVSHTGVGGLTLGGGMGWLSRRFGLTIDSLLSAVIVTADGQIVETGPENEPELFWGIRGGGGNFGVVTKFRFRMQPLGEVLIGNWEYPLAACKTALQTYRELAAKAPRELKTAVTLTSGGLSVTAFQSGLAAGAEALVAPYGRLAGTGSGTLGRTTFLELQSRGDDHFGWGRRYYAKGGFMQEISDDTITAMLDLIAQAPTPDSEIYFLQLGGAVADIPEDATAYSGRNADFYWIAEPVWDHAEFDEECLTWGRTAGACLSSMSSARNYVNEQGDAGREVALRSYGEAKYRRLARLKARFDPSNLFRLNQNIEPKM